MKRFAHTKYAKSKTIHLRLYFLGSILFVHMSILIITFSIEDLC